MTEEANKPAVVDLHTHWARQHAVKLRECLARFDLDVAKDVREQPKVHECKSCYYLRSPQLVGHAFTEKPCQLCGTAVRHPNTAVPKYCEACAVDNEMCRRCGGDIEMRNRVPRKPPKKSKRSKPG